MGRQSKEGRSGCVKQGCAWNICVRCPDGARRAARRVERLGQERAGHSKGEDFQTRRHLGARTDIPARHDRQHEATLAR
jgi:hypothetical protein